MPVDDGNCFACGPDNPIGLHLRFTGAAQGVCARIVLRDDFQGWKNIAHGGIAMALLDEAMAHAAGHAGHRGMTGSINVRFRKPVPLGKPLDICGWVAWQRRNVLGLEATVCDEFGTTLARADGNFVSMGPLDAVDDRRNPARAR
ncbi:MAG: PaaI family thioesterase [Candidatus Eremiobacteraeota bacterium]|nr:PaaI family thioesterase [Candidatus Eremiobacteraeota bacterium]